MKKRNVLALVMAAVMVVTGPLTMKSEARAEAETETKVVMSFNVLTTSTQSISKAPTVDEDIYRHSNADRGTRFQNMLDTYLPDSIGLCEVTESWKSYLDGTVINRTYGNGVPYSVAGYRTASGKTLKSGSGEYSPILYRSDRYTVADSETGGYWFSDTPNVKSKYRIPGHQASNGAVSMYFERVFSYAVLRDIETDEIAYIHVNVHYDHKSDEYINKLCSVQVINAINDLKNQYGADTPIVITGDQNRAEQTDSYAYLGDGNKGFRDAKYITDDRSTISSSAGYGKNYTPDSDWQIIDHVFVSEQWSVAKHEIYVDPFMSDHSAVYTRLVLNEKPVIDNISVSGASYTADIDRANNAYFEVSASQALLSASSSYPMLLETVDRDGAVLTAMDFNGSSTVELQDGVNVFQLVACGSEARNVYKVTINKTTSAAYPFVSEIYPNGSVSYVEIANAGGAGVNLGEYELVLGDINSAGVVASTGAVITELPERWLKPGEAVLVVYNGGELELDDVFNKDINESHMIMAAEHYANGSANGAVTLMHNGSVYNTSSYAGIVDSSVTSDQVFAFAVKNGNIVRNEYPEKVRYATPGQYESEVGALPRSAYEVIKGGTAQVLSDNIKKADDDRTQSYRLDNTVAGTYAYYTNIDFGTTSPASVELSVAGKSSTSGGTINMYINAGPNGDISGATQFASIATPGTGPDWTVYKSYSGTITGNVTGVQDVLVTFVPDAGKTYVGNLATIRFSNEANGAESEEEQVIRKAYERIQCEWAEDMTQGTKKDGSVGTPNYQTSENASNDETNGRNILGNTTKGSTVTYKNVDFGTVAPESISLNIAIKNTNCDGIIRIYTYDKAADGVRVVGDEVADIVINHRTGPTADYTYYQDVTGTILEEITGKHDLLMVFDVTKGYSYVGNMDYFIFEPKKINAFDIIEAEDIATEDMSGDKAGREGDIHTGMSSHVNQVGENAYTRVTGIDDTAELTYRYVDFGEGNVRSVVFNTLMNENNGGTITLYVDSVDDANEIGTVAFDNDIWVGGTAYEEAQLVEAPISAEISGVHDLILVSRRSTGMKWTCQLDYFYFTNDDARSAFENIQAEWGTDITGNDKVPAVKIGPARSYRGFDPYSISLSGYSKNYLGNTGSNGTVTYRNIDFGENGVSSCFINMAVKTSNCGGTTEIYVIDTDETARQIGYFRIPSTEGVSNDYNNYMLFEGTITDTSVYGVHDVMLKFVPDGRMTYVGNIDYFGFR